VKQRLLHRKECALILLAGNFPASMCHTQPPASQPGHLVKDAHVQGEP